MAADGDNRVIGIQRSTGDRNGKHLDVANCIVFELKDGKVSTVESTSRISTPGTILVLNAGRERSGWPNC